MSWRGEPADLAGAEADATRARAIALCGLLILIGLLAL
jgi:hypothetical protein